MNKKVKSEKNLNLKKNQEVSLTIEDFTKEGEGLGKYQGFPLFVKDTVIGDEVKVSITKLKKNYVSFLACNSLIERPNCDI